MTRRSMRRGPRHLTRLGALRRWRHRHRHRRKRRRGPVDLEDAHIAALAAVHARARRATPRRPRHGWRRATRALGMLLLAAGSLIVYVLAYQLITATVSADIGPPPQQVEQPAGVPPQGPGGSAPARASGGTARGPTPSSGSAGPI
ncbi:MAG TPA: hypothetical protein VKG45_04105 [Actinomycetes bacterium]|nr:hypothetical protein [Actinomycetes bacterium]